MIGYDSANRPTQSFAIINNTMYTIGQLAKQFSLSRSTLIYYDSIGLLTPSNRSDSNYRLYSDADHNKLEKIKLYREAGLTLDAITSLLNKEGNKLQPALENRLLSINSEIQTLRNQQKVIIHLLKNKGAINNSRIITKEIWISLLSAAGLDESGMKKWHVEFEKMSPEAHQDFLESLSLEQNEIKHIRGWSKKSKDKT